MFENVIIGIAEQHGCEDAIRLAQQLVAPGGKLRLVHIRTNSPSFGRGSESRADVDCAQTERAEKLLARACQASGVTSSVTFAASSVGRGLHQLAERRGADLLVVGSTRRGLVGRVLMSDDTREAINGSPCAVAIAPAGYADQVNEISEIGVAYNASSESEQALSVARELAPGRHARVSVVEVVSLPVGLTSGIVAPWGEIADAILLDAQERLGQLEDVKTHVAFGDVVEELTVYSASIDLLVVGSRDFGPLGRLIHSSTSRRLAWTARCPLLILTRAAGEPPRQHLTAQSNVFVGA